MAMAVEGWRRRLLFPVESQTTSVLLEQPNTKGIVHDTRRVPGLLWGFSAVPPAQKIRVPDVEVKPRACVICGDTSLRVNRVCGRQINSRKSVWLSFKNS